MNCMPRNFSDQRTASRLISLLFSVSQIAVELHSVSRFGCQAVLSKAWKAPPIGPGGYRQAASAWMRWVMSAPCCTRDAPIRAVLSHPWVGWAVSFISARYRRAPSRRRSQSSSPSRAIAMIRRATTSPVASAAPFEANGARVS